MQQPMKNQLLYFVPERQTIFFSLRCRTLQRHYNFTEVRFIFAFKLFGLGGEGKHVRRIVFATKLLIEFLDRRVANKDDGSVGPR